MPASHTGGPKPWRGRSDLAEGQQIWRCPPRSRRRPLHPAACRLLRPTAFRPPKPSPPSALPRLHLHLPSPSARRPHLTPLHCWRRFMSSTASILAQATTLASLRPSSTFGSAHAGSRVFDAASPAAVVLASRRLCWPLA